MNKLCIFLAKEEFNKVNELRLVKIRDRLHDVEMALFHNDENTEEQRTIVSECITALMDIKLNLDTAVSMSRGTTND